MVVVLDGQKPLVGPPANPRALNSDVVAIRVRQKQIFCEPELVLLPEFNLLILVVKNHEFELAQNILSQKDIDALRHPGLNVGF